MTEQPDPAPPPPPVRLPLPAVLAAVVLVGALLDLFCLLLLPVRVAGHLVPVAPLSVLVVNGILAVAACSLAASRLPAQVLLFVAIALSGAAAVRGPGGDLLVTRDLEGMYLLYVLAACFGAAAPLYRRARMTRRSRSH